MGNNSLRRIPKTISNVFMIVLIANLLLYTTGNLTNAEPALSTETKSIQNPDANEEQIYDTLGRQYTTNSPSKFTKTPLSAVDLKPNAQNSIQLKNSENEKYEKLKTKSPEKNTKLKALKVENLDSILNPSAIPTEPINVVVTTFSNTIIRVIWSPPENNGGFPITGYQLRRTTVSTSNMATLNFPATQRSYYITGLSPGNEYSFQIAAKNFDGLSPFSSPVSATTFGPPGAPILQTISTIDRSITLTWTPPMDNGGFPILSYTIERSVGDNSSYYTFAVGVSTLTYTAYNLNKGETYYFRLKAFNTNGAGALSNSLFEIVAATTPDVPTVLTATANGTTIIVSWSPPSDTGGLPATYIVSRFEADGTITNISTSEIIYIDSGLNKSSTYMYKVLTNNNLGESVFTSSVSVTIATTVPGVPTGLTAIASGTTITVSWMAPVDTGGLPIAYIVSRLEAGGTVINIITSETTNIDNGLNKSSTYIYKVLTNNNLGESAFTSPASATITTTVPGAPTGLTATANGTTTTVSWTAPVDTGGLPVTYIVSRLEADGTVTNFTTSEIIYTDSGLNKNSTYIYKVLTSNNLGESAFISPVSATIATTAPDIPTGLIAIASGTTITVSWTAPVDTGGLPITYIVSRLEVDGTVFNITTSETIHIDYELNKNSTYIYKVLTNNSLGESAFTPPISATIATTVPGVPTELTASASGTTITVSWMVPLDTGGLLISYIVSRLEADGTVTNSTTSETTYTDSGLNKSSTYIYKVLTSNNLGESAFISPVSATIATTIPSIPTGLMAIASGTTITVSWTAPVDTGGLPVAYIVSRLEADGTVTNFTTSKTTYTDSELNKSSTYMYKVLTNNSLGASVFTSSVSLTIATTVPGIPIGLTATASGTTITVSWTAPIDTGGLPIAYIVSRLEADGTVTNSTTSETIYTDNGLNKSSTYMYRVLTNNGIGESAFTFPVSVTIATTTPDIPTGLMVTPSGTAITVSWMAPFDTGGLPVIYIVSRLEADGTVINITTSEITYTDSGLNKSSTYIYKVLTSNNLGESAFTPPVSATIATTVPGVPTELTATASGTTITVVWMAPVDMGGLPVTYIVSRLEADDGTVTNITTSETTYTDSELNKSSTYMYKVLSNNSLGESVFTSSVSVTIATTVPSVPTGLTVTASGTTITVSWTVPSDAGGLPVIYIVSRLEADGTVTNSTTSEITYTDSGLNKSSTYMYRVLSNNSLGESIFTASHSATIATTSPSVPTGLMAIESGTTITVSWTAPVDTGGLPIAYIVSRLEADGTVTNSTTSETIYTDGGLNKSSTYMYRVLTNNNLGESVFTVFQSATITTTVPSVPTGLIVTASGTTIIVSWTASVDMGGLSIGYIISRLEADGTVTNITISETIYIDSGLNKSSTYMYKVLSNNSLGESTFTSSVSATIATTVPGVPTGLTATASGTTITVSWIAPTDMGGLSIGYIVSRLEADGTVTNITTRETIYIDSGLNKSSTYMYKVLSNNSLGESVFTFSQSATIATTVPEVSTELTAITSGTTVTISWTAPVDMGGLSLAYTIARSENGGEFTNISTSQVEVNYLDSNLTKGSTYSYKVTSENSVGDSVFTTSQSVTIATTVPGIPTGLMVTVSGTTITVSWTAPVDTGGLTISNYTVARSKDGGAFSDVSTEQTALTFAEQNLAKGSTYIYKVVAKNNLGVSAFTDPVSAIIPITAPDVPTGVTVVISGSLSLTVTWTTPLDDGGVSLANYTVERSDDDGSTFSSITTITDISTTSYQDTTGLIKGKEYYYRVNARNLAGLSIISNPVSEVAATTPSSPNGVNVIISGNLALTVTWIIPSDNGGVSLANYMIERSDDDGLTFSSTITITDISTTSYQDTAGLIQGREYRYRVNATNLAGFSAVSTIGLATAATDPSAPSDVGVSVSGNLALTVTWTVPSDDGGISLANYTIQRSGDDGLTFSAIATITDISTTNYQDTSGLTKGREYRYRVNATNLAGFSAVSTIGLATAATNPTAPSGISVLASGSLALTITWTIPSDDGGVSLANYMIERSDDDGLTFSSIIIANTSITSYEDTTGLTKGKEYQYRVNATNLAGFSAVSAVGSATAATNPTASSGVSVSVSGSLALTIIWTAPSDNGGVSFANYTIQRSDDDGSTFSSIITITDISTTSYEDTTELIKGIEYYYRVNTTNFAGFNIGSNPVSEFAATTPSSPNDVSVSVSDSLALTITWIIPFDNGGVSLADYMIERSDDDGFTFSSITTVTDASITSYEDTAGLIKGREYQYRVKATNLAGFSAVSTIGLATAATNPTAPSGVSVSVSGSLALIVTWTVPSDTGGVSLANYTVQHSPDNGLTFSSITTITDASITSYEDITGLTKGREYQYRVKATNLAGFSAVSTIGLAIATTNPTAPSGVSVSISGSLALTVTWTVPSDTGGVSLVNYLIERSDDDGSTFSSITTIADTSVTSYEDTTGLIKGRKHQYRVNAMNLAGFNATSVIGLATAVANPTAPSDVNVSASGSLALTVTWTVPSDDGGISLTNYKVERSDDDGSTFSSVATITNTSTTSYEDTTGLVKGKEYRYRVNAANLAGLNSISIPVIATAITVPGIPNNFLLPFTNATVVELSWTVPSDDGSSPITNYIIERSIDTGSFTSLVADVTTTSFNDATVIKGTTYSYRVLAVNSIGSSAPSSVQQVEIESVEPSILSSNDETLELGLTTLINWTVTDTNPSSYYITRNGVSVQGNTAWASGSVINYTTSKTLGVGVYNFTVYFIDVFDNFATSSIQVIIEDTTVPSIPSITSEIIEFKTNTTLTWKPTDLSSGTYNITRNDEAVVTGIEWSSDMDLNFTVSNSLALGSYNYTVTVRDASGNFASNSVIVIVEDTISPEFLTTPSGQLDLTLTDSVLLEWTATDLDPAGYTISKNSEIVKSGTWAVGQSINITFSNQLTGPYRYTLNISDGSGNFAIDKVVLTVTRVGSSIVTNPPSSSTTNSSTKIFDNRFVQIVILLGGIVSILSLNFVIGFLIRRRKKRKSEAGIITYE